MDFFKGIKMRKNWVWLKLLVEYWGIFSWNTGALNILNVLLGGSDGAKLPD